MDIAVDQSLPQTCAYILANVFLRICHPIGKQMIRQLKRYWDMPCESIGLSKM